MRAFACMHTCVCMHAGVYEHLSACTCACIHVCTCMRVCTFCNTPTSIEVGVAGFVPPPNIEKLPTPMKEYLWLTYNVPVTLCSHNR